jgi:two-component system, NtrC family, response regulator HydG
MRSGYGIGERLAKQVQEAFPKAGLELWVTMAREIAQSVGLAKVDLISREFNPKTKRYLAQIQITNSFEADVHLEEFGEVPFPVCNLSSGFTAGLLSTLLGSPIYAKEIKCRAMGDDACVFENRDEKSWKEEAHRLRSIFQPQSIKDRIHQTSQPGIKAESDAPHYQKRFHAMMKRPFVFRSPQMNNIVDQVAMLSDLSSPVLIAGESGTGKDHIAQLLHDMGNRRDQPYIPLNCAAVPEQLLESELFGHKKGAFTGADRDHQGLMESGNGGTLFLDEIGEMPLGLQAKLLRVLQDGLVRPVGSSQSKKVDVRIVAATNAELEQMVRDGSFREDLFYRLNVFTLTVPPLRERHEDILPLINHFMEYHAGKHNKQVPLYDQKVISMLYHHQWSGNVRELSNLVERLVVFAEGQTVTTDLLQSQLSPHSAGTLDEEGVPNGTLEEIEKRVILKTLEQFHGQRAETARKLGISTATLWRKLKTYGIQED